MIEVALAAGAVLILAFVIQKAPVPVDPEHKKLIDERERVMQERLRRLEKRRAIMDKLAREEAERQSKL